MKKKALFLFILIIILLSPVNISHQQPKKLLIIWNVGQGQWITIIEREQCVHFDMGGEFFTIRPFNQYCKGKENHLYLSHWDWDHINGLQRVKNFCIGARPNGPAPSKHKSHLISNLHKCTRTPHIAQILPESPTAKSQNKLSSVFIYDTKVLTSGDSPISEEKKWIHKIKNIGNIKYFILGHHGSKTSTSPETIQEMKNLKMAFVSARWARYHHPHPQVEAILKYYRVPLLKTEVWGSMALEID